MIGLMPINLECHTVTKVNNNWAIICGGYDGICITNKIFVYNIGFY